MTTLLILLVITFGLLSASPIKSFSEDDPFKEDSPSSPEPSVLLNDSTEVHMNEKAKLQIYDSLLKYIGLDNDADSVETDRQIEEFLDVSIDAKTESHENTNNTEGLEEIRNASSKEKFDLEGRLTDFNPFAEFQEEISNESKELRPMPSLASFVEASLEIVNDTSEIPDQSTQNSTEDLRGSSAEFDDASDESKGYKPIPSLSRFTEAEMDVVDDHSEVPDISSENSTDSLEDLRRPGFGPSLLPSLARITEAETDVVDDHSEVPDISSENSKDSPEDVRRPGIDSVGDVNDEMKGRKPIPSLARIIKAEMDDHSEVQDTPSENPRDPLENLRKHGFDYVGDANDETKGRQPIPSLARFTEAEADVVDDHSETLNMSSEDPTDPLEDLRGPGFDYFGDVNDVTKGRKTLPSLSRFIEAELDVVDNHSEVPDLSPQDPLEDMGGSSTSFHRSAEVSEEASDKSDEIQPIPSLASFVEAPANPSDEYKDVQDPKDPTPTESLRHDPNESSGNFVPFLTDYHVPEEEFDPSQSRAGLNPSIQGHDGATETLIPSLVNDGTNGNTDPGQSRAGFNPFVKSLSVVDDLIVESPALVHIAHDDPSPIFNIHSVVNSSKQVYDHRDDDEFSTSLMSATAEDDHDDEKQEIMSPFFPLFGAPLLSSVVESLQRLQDQVQNMWNTYGNFNASTLDTLPDNYKNATSTLKLLDGHVFQVNETVNKEIINGIPHLFHLKVIALKPTNKTESNTTTLPWPHIDDSTWLPLPAHVASDNGTVLSSLVTDNTTVSEPVENSTPLSESR